MPAIDPRLSSLWNRYRQATLIRQEHDLTGHPSSCQCEWTEADLIAAYTAAARRETPLPPLALPTDALEQAVRVLRQNLDLDWDAAAALIDLLAPAIQKATLDSAAAIVASTRFDDGDSADDVIAAAAGNLWNADTTTRQEAIAA